MDFHQNTVPETDNDNQNNVNYTTNTNDGTQYNQPVEDTVQNTNDVTGQAQMSYENSVQSPYQPQQPYGNNAQSPHQTQQPYGNNVQSPYQPQQPYGNEGRYPYQNNSTPNYQNGNPYANNNGNPYYRNTAQGTNARYNNSGYGNNGYNYNNNGYNTNYGQYAYPMNVSEPGSKLATAATVLGIISIVLCFTFTIYPAFITGSIAVVLALLSKGRHPKLLRNARIGIICAVIGLVSNMLLITGFTVRYCTDEDFRAQVNQTVKDQYGQSLDEILEEILEDSGYSN